MKTLDDLLAHLTQPSAEPRPSAEWGLCAVQSEDCLSYIAWNTRTREALLVDPKDHDLPAYQKKAAELEDYRWIAVVDTHTHADHISIASKMAHELRAPLVMHVLSPSQRVDLRVSHDTWLPATAAPLHLWHTAGHTPDSMTAAWGPYVFAGDTVLYGDSGRDDLPGGNASAHYESLQKLKRVLKSDQIFLPGHDHKGGRASSWGTQLANNGSLTQERDDFVRESEAFDAPAPKLLKRSLRENFK